MKKENHTAADMLGRYIARSAEQTALLRAGELVTNSDLTSATAAQNWFPEIFRQPFARMHYESLHRYDGIVGKGDGWDARQGHSFAIAAPRGSAKSTIHSLLLPLLDIVFRREQYIVIISATEKQACGRLKSLRDLLLRNGTLTRHFHGELPKAGKPWNRKSICINGVRVDAYGARAEIRGISHGPARPTKIILDDVEDSELVLNGENREKTLAWFNEVVENLGDTYTHIDAAGTILHPESLLATLLKRPDFEGRIYRSVIRWSAREDLWMHWRRLLTTSNESGSAETFLNQHQTEMLADTEVLWPEKESYEMLMQQLATRGRSSFWKEKQNEPLGADNRLEDEGPKFATGRSHGVKGRRLF